MELEFSLSEMESMRDSAAAACIGEIEAPAITQLADFTNAGITTILFGLIKKIGVLGVGVYETLLGIAVDFTNNTIDNNKRTYYYTYQDIAQRMRTSGFTHVRLEGYFHLISEVINGQTVSYYVISGFPSAVAYRTSDGTWLSIN